MRRGVGSLYVFTALVTGCWSIYLIGLASVGGPSSWWYTTTLGASALLLVGGVHIALPRIKQLWLVALAAGVSLVAWNLGVWLREALIFSLVLAIVSWGTLAVASAWNRPWIVAFIASVILAAWWIPASVRTLTIYFSPKPASLDPVWLLWSLTPCLLVIVSLVAGVTAATFGAWGIDRP